MPDRNVNARRYRERLNPPIWAWVAVLGITVSLTVAVWVPLGLVAGIIALVIINGLALWGMLVSTPTITVNDTELRINRVHIDVNNLGIVATLDAQATANANGANADPRAFMISRPLSAKESVTVEILDDDDPHPYWLISTSHPAELGRAIRDAMLASATSETTR
ncbi:MAG: DUF3093 domain-containing protein [Actinobacteria bacterium]|nr:DUF3093 domain-containing protein [Actinomycetota bacterium]